MRRQRTQKKSELQMGIKPMTLHVRVTQLCLELRFFLSSLSLHIFVYLIYYNDCPVRNILEAHETVY